MVAPLSCHLVRLQRVCNMATIVSHIHRHRHHARITTVMRALCRSLLVRRRHRRAARHTSRHCRRLRRRCSRRVEDSRNILNSICKNAATIYKGNIFDVLNYIMYIVIYLYMCVSTNCNNILRYFV